MFKNYIKIAFRSLMKHKVYALLNILGLTIGITCSFFIYLFVNDELTYDGQHTNGDQIYRVACEYFLPNDGGSEKWATASDLIPQYFVKDYPEIISSVRFRRNQNVVIEKPNGIERYYETIVLSLIHI